MPDSRRMRAVFLHGAGDLRCEGVPAPSAPAPGEVLLRVTATGICGSDLHTYKDGGIGGTRVEAPLVLGHEFAGVVEETGEQPTDGVGATLRKGQRVAVDPAVACGICEFCQKGHPNLCQRLRFCGLYPDHGSLREFMTYPAKCCFPLPDNLSDIEGALLEPLGVAMHAVDLAKLKVGDRVAILGAGPIGLLILKMTRLSGALPLLVTDPLPWRLGVANQFGALNTLQVPQNDPVRTIQELTGGRGVDVAFEAAWAAETVEQSVEAVRLGGKVIVVGIPSEDAISIPASSARRKGLTIKMSRRMKHIYPRALQLVQQHDLSLMPLVSHRFTLEEASEAFKLNGDYRDEVLKVIIEPSPAK